ncbi:hypothetical protein F444_01087 [Phytophthora nicotianae P1976]|uniref:Uncharacterized protein n=1 Tax=Phytophthora nicotianae P1976 TaxID=1317066 RepID=A0A081B1Q0_PHYNI|nr:hypothetical protein F444_01087 [Phytophthora nicotianae P1976]
MALWEKDNKQRGGPSSLDVLLRWLLTTGNYERWTLNSKISVAKEVVVELVAHGINNRTAKGVLKKIRTLEQEFKSAKEWLTENDLEHQYLRGETSKGANDTVRQLCPRYRKLVHVFDRSAGSKAESDTAPRRRELNAGRSTQKKPRVQGSGDEFNARPGTQKKPRVLGPGKELNAGRDTQKKPRALDLRRSSKDSNGSEGKSSVVHPWPSSSGRQTSEKGQLDPAPKSDKCCEAYSDVKDVKDIVKSDEVLDQRLLECEIEHKRTLFKCHLEGEQKREEVRTMCEVMLSRHKLLNAGVAEEIVDHIFPVEY